MNPREKAVYEAYPRLLPQMVGAVQTLAALPLEEMRAAVARMTLTGAFMGAAHARALAPAVLLRQRHLIDAVIELRDTALALAGSPELAAPEPSIAIGSPVGLRGDTDLIDRLDAPLIEPMERGGVPDEPDSADPA